MTSKVTGRRIELAARRRAMGFTQESLASRIGIEQTTVKRWELGHRTPGPATRPALAAALELSLVELDGLLSDPGPQFAVHQQRGGTSSDSPPMDGHQEDEGDDPTNRRQLITTAISAAGASLLGTGHDGLGEEDEQLVQLPALYRRLDAQLPSHLLIEPSISHLRLLEKLLATVQPGSQRDRRLSAGLSETAGLAAWLSADMDGKQQSRYFYQRAAAAAARSGHSFLGAYMVASLGQFAASSGEPAQGLRLVQRARSSLSSAPPLATIWLDTLEGAARAARGQMEALHLFDRAEARLGRLGQHEPVWPWLFRFDAPKLAGYRAQAAVHLNQPALALTSFNEALTISQAPKQLAMLHVSRATALMQDSQYEEACRVAGQAFDIGRHHSSARITHAVSRFRAELEGYYAGEEVDALDHKMHAVYTDSL